MANGKFILNKLFGSTARVKLLKFFLSRTGEKFYIRQVARELELQLNSVRRELDNLESFGILKSSSEPDPGKQVAEEEAEIDEGEEQPKKVKVKDVVSRTDKKYYTVDKNFILYEEIKALFIKAHVLYEQDFSEKVLKAGRPKLMILTGFFTGNESSPTDMLIVGRLDKDKLTAMIKELEDEMGRELNYTMMDTKEYYYRRDITDVFLYEILENNKIVVVDDLDKAE